MVAAVVAGSNKGMSDGTGDLAARDPAVGGVGVADAGLGVGRAVEAL